MAKIFAREYVGEDTKLQLEKSSLILRDFTATVNDFSLDIGDENSQPQAIGTTDTYSFVGEVDLSTIFIKNTTPASVGTLVVTGVIP